MSIKSMTKAISGLALVLLVIAALGPGKWVPRSGLGWQFDHVAGYMAFTWMVCLAWPRPQIVAGAIMALAVLLEALQALTPDRHADVQAAFLNAGAVLSAALIAQTFIRAPRIRTARTHLMAHGFRLFEPAWHNARTAFLTAYSRGRCLLIIVARGVAPQSPASVRLVARPIPVTPRTESLLRAQMVSSRSGPLVLKGE
jgi:hypothetical protein